MAPGADDELMALVRRRDPAAFGHLVRRHLASLHRYLTRLTGSTADADELCQETFLRVWQRAASYRPGKVRLTTWLHRVAHNLAVDELRRRRDPPGAHEEAVDPVGPERLAEAAEADQRLRRALDRLPATQRSALLLCQVQGLSNREAASVMGVSVRGLESLLARGRRTLREALLDTADDGLARSSRTPRT